jgi:carbamoyl-phosphate synthase large subunit
MNILFTNAGRRTYLIEYALELKKNGYDMKIFVCDTSLDTAAMHVSSEINFFITPKVSSGSEKYLDVLFQECIKNDIKVIVPLMDFELPILAKNKPEFEKKGIMVWVSDYDLVMNCLDKQKNYQFCNKHNIPVPKSTFVYSSEIHYPVVKKKIIGSGSVGLELIRHNTGQHISFKKGEDMFQDLIEGKEIGMDVFNDYNGKYVDSCVKGKLLMRNGETDKARVFLDERFETIARNLSNTLKHVGNMDIDLIEKENGEILFIDFNPRFGGGYAFTHASGANYLKYIIEQSSGKNITKIKNKKPITGMKGIRLFVHQ